MKNNEITDSYCQIITSSFRKILKVPYCMVPYFIFFICACLYSDIFYFLQSDWLAAAGSFLRYLDRGPKVLFFENKSRSGANCRT